MSEKFVRKQVYECTKCKKLFDSKEEFNEHYEMMHGMMEKYEGAYIVSKDGKQVGKVLSCAPTLTYPPNLTYSTIIFGSTTIPFNLLLKDILCVSKAKCHMRAEDLEKGFDIVTKDVFKDQLEKIFIETGYATLKSYPGTCEILSDLTEKDEYRLKGDNNGN